jgi:hypothetical protein
MNPTPGLRRPRPASVSTPSQDVAIPNVTRADAPASATPTREHGLWCFSVPWDRADDIRLRLCDMGIPIVLDLDHVERTARLELPPWADPAATAAAIPAILSRSRSENVFCAPSSGGGRTAGCNTPIPVPCTDTTFARLRRLGWRVGEIGTARGYTVELSHPGRLILATAPTFELAWDVARQAAVAVNPPGEDEDRRDASNMSSTRPDRQR